MFAKLVNLVKNIFTKAEEAKTETPKMVVTNSIINECAGKCETVQLVAHISNGKVISYSIKTIGHYTKNSTIVMRKEAHRALMYFEAQKSIYC